MTKHQQPKGFDALFNAIERVQTTDDSSIIDKDGLPENTQKSTWEERLKEEEVYNRRQNLSLIHI